MPSYELFENGNDHFLIAMIVFLVERNELLNLIQELFASWQVLSL